MDSTVLILDQNSSPCVAGNCDSIAGLLRESLPLSSCVEQRCNRQLPESVGPVPDVVLVRPAASIAAHELVSSCKERWGRASILALLCPSRDRLLEAMSPLLARVDDFIACPFERLEFFARIGRLLQRHGVKPDPSSAASNGKKA